MTNDDFDLPGIARGQHGAFLFEQASRAGVPANVLRGWIESGLLDQFGVRTLRSATAPTSPVDDAAAYLLDIKPKAWISHATAAAMHGFDTFGNVDLPLHVTLQRGTFTSRPNVIVHTSDEFGLEDRVLIDGIAVTSPIRTLIDLARRESAARLTTVIDGALRDRLIVEEALLRRIAQIRTQGRYGIPKLLAVIEGVETTRGGQSWLERRYLQLAAAGGLPRPETQRRLGRVDGRLIRVDCYYPDVDLVVELLGYRWHRSRAQMQRDAQRVNRLQLDGRLVLQFTYDQVTLGPQVVLATVVEARCKRLRQKSA
jgi:very-short-patch-repair endonuclease